MAFTVKLRFGNYRISLGDGRQVDARNVDEICQAIHHYYAVPRHTNNPKDCPLCRDA